MDVTDEIPTGLWKSAQKDLSEWGINNNNISIQDTRGTFANNMKAPIHRWFRFAAGFSYDLVEESFRSYGVNSRKKVLDPFLGSGTTSVCSKKLGISSVGVEAHLLISWVAKVKTYWDFDFKVLKQKIEQHFVDLEPYIKSNLIENIDEKPKLLSKCFTPKKLSELYAVKNYLLDVDDEHIRNLGILALLSTLRKVSKAHTGWPYVLPRVSKKNPHQVFESFCSQFRSMILDLELVVTDQNKKVESQIFTGDAKQLSAFIDNKTIDFVFTSPPYLNNYDYADRTRLESYFLSPFKINEQLLNTTSWSDITEQIRKKLMVNVSHQAKEMGLKEGLLPDDEMSQKVREKLIDISEKLRKEKQVHGGHKAYDISVVAYFNDMFKIMSEVYSVMKPKAYFLLVLGDSAPYGIHVPTDVFLAKIGRSIGFSEAKIGLLRKRGGKWKSAPKHDVPLRESVVILKKA